MATSFGIYYIDSSSFLTATAVWTDITLSTKAVDGYYQFAGVYRQQVSGLLLPVVTCPTCAVVCPLTIVESGGQGSYTFNMDMGHTTGQFTIRFTPGIVMDGIRIVFNGITYPNATRQFVSEVYGVQTGPYMGVTNCSLVAGSPWVLPSFVYNNATNSFDATALSTPVTITAGQLDVSAADPGVCSISIPKPSITPSTLSVQVISACSTADWKVEVFCPQAIPSHFHLVSSSALGVTSVAACALPLDKTWYRLATKGTANKIDINDVLYADQFSVNKLADYSGSGFYRNGALNWFEIDSASLVTSVGAC